MNKQKRLGLAEPLAPWLLVIILVFIVIIAIIAYLKATSLIYSEQSRNTNYALHAMLESTDCAPITKQPFRNVLAIGIGEGKTGDIGNDEVLITYGGKTEPPIKPAECFDKLSAKILGPTGGQFYVDYPAFCKSWARKGCFGSYTGYLKDINKLNVESFEYIALPNGDVARAVLKTKG